MYLHVVDTPSNTISAIPEVLKVIDAKYDFLKDYYAGFAIENVVVSLFFTFQFILQFNVNWQIKVVLSFFAARICDTKRRLH